MALPTYYLRTGLGGRKVYGQLGRKPYATGGRPVISRQVSSRLLSSWRYAGADNRCRRGRKYWGIGPYADRKRWA
jgi:hypothetical protein